MGPWMGALGGKGRRNRDQKHGGRIADPPSSPLPEIRGFHLRRSGLTVDDLRAQHELHILLSACQPFGAEKLCKIVWISKKLAGGDGPASSNPGHDHRRLARDIVGKARDDRKVLVVVGGQLLRSIDRPTYLRRICAVDDAKLRHVRVVAEVITERLCQTQSPSVVKGT